jgi:DNA-directed RNA polymerase subunit RPC12/RpoP
MIRFACPNCGKHLKAPEERAGQKVSCPRCSQRLLIPSHVPPAPVRLPNEGKREEIKPLPAQPPADLGERDDVVLLGLREDVHTVVPPPRRSEPVRDGPAGPPHTKAYGYKALLVAAALGAIAGGTLVGAVAILIGFLVQGRPQPVAQATPAIVMREEAPAPKQPEKPAVQITPSVRPASTEPKKPQEPVKPVKPDEPPLNCGDMKVGNQIYKAYGSNEAAADGEYLNKRVQFNFSPWAIDKDERSGAYYAWSNIFGLSDDNTRGRHFRCYFRADQAAALSKFQRGQVLTIIGVCAGKTGMVTTYYQPVFNDGTRGFFKSNPAIAFKDCVLVKDVSVPVPEKHISAAQLLSEYKANQDLADRKYRDKWIVIDGTVERVAKNASDEIYAIAFPDVECHFHAEYAGRTAQLTPGQWISVRGKCVGLSPGIRSSRPHVVINNCELVGAN